MKRKRMTKRIYEGLREMRAYVNGALSSGDFPNDLDDTERAEATQEWLDQFLNDLGVKYDDEEVNE